MSVVITKSAQETKAIARAFARAILKEITTGKKAMVIMLSGQLGAGKTTFAQGFAAGLGVKEKTKSPTFVLMRQHAIKGKHFTQHLFSHREKSGSTLDNKKGAGFTHFYHLDCYRLESYKEADSIGLKEVLADPRNIVLVEWPEKIKKALPRKAIMIRFLSINENSRKLSLLHI